MSGHQGPSSLGYLCVASIVKHIEDPACVHTLSHVPAELVDVILDATLRAGKLRTLGVLKMFLACGHPSVVSRLESMDLSAFQTRCYGVGLTPKMHSH
eukprot:COSAG01_NODE_16147_length_1265_cov_11.399657_2_plen_98_part_00